MTSFFTESQQTKYSSSRILCYKTINNIESDDYPEVEQGEIPVTSESTSKIYNLICSLIQSILERETLVKIGDRNTTHIHPTSYNFVEKPYINLKYTISYNIFIKKTNFSKLMQKVKKATMKLTSNKHETELTAALKKTEECYNSCCKFVEENKLLLEQYNNENKVNIYDSEYHNLLKNMLQVLNELYEMACLWQKYSELLSHEEKSKLPLNKYTNFNSGDWFIIRLNINTNEKKIEK